MTGEYTYTFEDYAEGNKTRTQRVIKSQQQSMKKRIFWILISYVVGVCVFLYFGSSWRGSGGITPRVSYDFFFEMVSVLIPILFLFSIVFRSIPHLVRPLPGQPAPPRMRVWRGMRWISSATALGLTIWLIYSTWSTTWLASKTELMIIRLLPWLIAITVIVMVIRRGASASVRTFWTLQPSLQLPKRAEVTAEGITVIDDNVIEQHRWPHFIYYEESANLILLYPNPNQFVMLPKRAFDESNLLALRSLIFKNIVNGKFLHDFTGFQVLPARAALPVEEQQASMMP